MNINNYISWRTAQLRSLIWAMRYHKKRQRAFFFKPLYITPRHITWGNGVIIYKNCRIEGVTSYQGVSFTPSIVLEDGVSIQQNAHITCAERIVIGANTALAANVTITDIHHPYDNVELSIEEQPIAVNPVSIGPNCKIYNNAVILPGTKIGKHVTIGASSVVSGEIPDYCVVVGVPARIVKRYNFVTKQWGGVNADGNFNE